VNLDKQHQDTFSRITKKIAQIDPAWGDGYFTASISFTLAITLKASAT
jgi:hypothetical protein